MIRIDDALRDRGSRYAVTGAPATNRVEVEGHITTLKREKRFAKATHHSWALVSSTEGPLKNDDGESGAGAVILKMLEREALTDFAIIVTRWYGGTHLGGDRFAHIVTCTRALLDAKRKGG